VRNLSHNFLCSISTTMFPRSLLTTRRVHVRARALKRRMAAHFSNKKGMYMRNIHGRVRMQIFS